MEDMRNENKMDPNIEIRNKFNIATIGSLIFYRNCEMYISWISTMSIAYLNNKSEIEIFLENINKYIDKLRGGD